MTRIPYLTTLLALTVCLLTLGGESSAQIHDDPICDVNCRSQWLDAGYACEAQRNQCEAHARSIFNSCFADCGNQPFLLQSSCRASCSSVLYTLLQQCNLAWGRCDATAESNYEACVAAQSGCGCETPITPLPF